MAMVTSSALAAIAIKVRLPDDPKKAMKTTFAMMATVKAAGRRCIRLKMHAITVIAMYQDVAIQFTTSGLSISGVALME